MPDALLIAGYYRSGTSALSGALQRLGVTLHNDAEANEHNPLGFYEIPELIEFDIELFNRLGTEWTDIRWLPKQFEARADVSGFVVRLEEILRRRFGNDPLWAVKHPHLCRLLPLYERAARQAGNTPKAIHILREPWAVAASQARKNSLSRAHAVLLWASYVTQAEYHARHLPRTWLTYDELLAKPEATLRRIGESLAVDFESFGPAAMESASAFLTGELNRSAAAPKLDLAKPLLTLVEDIWDAARAGDHTAPTWDGFAARCAELAGLLTELAASRMSVLPSFGAGAVAAAPPAPALRPPERCDEGARRRLMARREQMGALPSVAVMIAAPPSRAHALGDTLESLRAQWFEPASVKIISVDPVALAGHEVTRVPAESGALTRALCAALNESAEHFDYVAVLNAGDFLAPDACLRFALQARVSGADLIYCDEIVPADRGPWVRHKPGWDVTRLRQSAYIGDWVWYGADMLRRIGGFDGNFAGVEEYETQLRFAEANARVARLPEALFTRALLSRRDNIPATVFGQKALDAVKAHLEREGIGGAAAPRAYLGLFRHERETEDPGTAIVLLCDHADLKGVNAWTTALLSGPELSGPIILAGAQLAPPVASYLTQVAAAPALRGKVMAVPPSAGLRPGEALRRALALTACPQVAIIDAGAAPMAADWLPALRARLADPAAALASARTLVPLAKDPGQFMVLGPIIRGADTRLGAGHLSDDPGPGGWLAVDQEASAVAPGALLARRPALAACRFEKLDGDALWIDLGAQLRAAGHRIVWTPDVSFIARPESIRPDPQCGFRAGGPAARALPAADDYHNPALSLRGDLLAPEQRFGLVPAAPADDHDLLLSGPPEDAICVLNAARALRMAGALEAGWAPEPLLPAETARRAASAWIRINPEAPPLPLSGRHAALFTRPPKPDAQAALAAAAQLFGTSPAVVAALKALAPGRPITLWRPALSTPVWADFMPVAGMNTRPRVLWVDEGIAPAWLPDLINEMAPKVAWIVVERAGSQYAGELARLKAPADEQGWARELAAVAPQILLRPAGAEAAADHYVALLGAAAGCHLLVDDRLDIPEALGARRLPNDPAAWRQALTGALANLVTTLEAGARARRAWLGLPGLETAPPAWAGERAAPPAARTAAE